MYLLKNLSKYVIIALNIHILQCFLLLFIVNEIFIFLLN